MLTIAFLVMQFIISAKAGLVNAVEGPANVRIEEQVPAGSPIQTSATGRVEILLNPGSFLRLGENSSVVLDSVELTNIGIRIVSGSAIIESGTIEKDSPIRVTTGQLTLVIVVPGLYRFSEGAESVASVLEGELRTTDSAVSINKGSQIIAAGPSAPFEKRKIPTTEQVSALDDWSQQRSKQIASANSQSTETDSALNSEGLMPRQSLMSPFLYPGGILPYALPPRALPSLTPFSFFQWYDGGYRYLQPLTPGVPVIVYPPFRIGRPRPLPPMPPSLSHPPTNPTNLSHPPRPGPSRGRR